MSELSFTNPETARRLRDVVDRLATEAVRRERPGDRKGTVTAIDPDNRQCFVQFPGAPTSVPVVMGALQPRNIGQIVRCSVLATGDLVVVDVEGAGILTGETTDELPVPTGLLAAPGYGSVVLDWDDMPNITQYDVQVSNLSQTLVRTQRVQSSEAVFSGLDYETPYFATVRSVNYPGTAVSEYVSPSISFVTLGDPALTGGSSSDGNPPSASPQPTVRGGIGSIFAEWSPIENGTDTVVYEVHVSILSGFTPDSTTLFGETTSTFANIDALPNGVPLTNVTGSNIFVRLIAKDSDGAANVGAQGFAMPRRVETGDVGTINVDQIRDGSAPGNSPDPVVTGGYDTILVTWEHVVNADPLTYEVHMSTVTNFVPNINTLVTETPSTWAFITNETPQINPAEPVLSSATTYYVKLVAKDLDGVAPYSAASEGVTVAGLVDRLDATLWQNWRFDDGIGGVFTLKAFINEAKIVNGDITNLAVAHAQISRADIQALSVDTAQINTAAIIEAKIEDLAVTFAKIDTVDASSILAGTIGAEEIILAGGSSGIIRSDNWVDGTLGWIIRGDGTAQFNQLAVNTTLDVGGSDNTSFHVDVDGNMWLGSSTYAGAPWRVSNDGRMRIGFLGGNTAIYTDISGNMWAGQEALVGAPWILNPSGDFTATNVTLNGFGAIRTAVSGERVELPGTSAPGDILLYTGDLAESANHSITTSVVGSRPRLQMLGAEFGPAGGINRAFLDLWGRTNLLPSEAALSADIVSLTAGLATQRTLEWDGTQLDSTGALSVNFGFGGPSEILSVIQDLDIETSGIGADINIRTLSTASQIFFHTANAQRGVLDGNGTWFFGPSTIPAGANPVVGKIAHFEGAAGDADRTVSIRSNQATTTTPTRTLELQMATASDTIVPSNWHYLTFNGWNGTELAQVRGHGTNPGVVYDTAPSDARLKDHLAFDDETGYRMVEAVPMRRFAWLETGNEDYGTFAQDFMAAGDVCSVVSVGRGEPGDDDFRPHMLSREAQVPYLWGAVRYLIAELKALRGD